MTRYAPRCPHCRSPDACRHALLIADVHFQHVEDGAFADAFYERWQVAKEAAGGQFDDITTFRTLLDEVDALATGSCEFESGGGPGMATLCKAYYFKEIKQIPALVEKFRSQR